MSPDPHAPSPAEPGHSGPLDSDVPESRSADPAHDDPAASPPENALKFTRTAALWTALIVGLLVLIVLLVFITQNTESVEMTFLGWHWRLPLGVQILLAAVLGSLITVMAGAARMAQLRRAAKKNYKAALK